MNREAGALFNPVHLVSPLGGHEKCEFPPMIFHLGRFCSMLRNDLSYSVPKEEDPQGCWCLSWWLWDLRDCPTFWVMLCLGIFHHKDAWVPRTCRVLLRPKVCRWNSTIATIPTVDIY